MKIILFLFSFIMFLFPNEIASLLKKIEINSDLSEKTKIENGGVYFIFKRSDLERMQVKTLKDIILTLPMIEYKESSYGFPDLFTYGDNKAFMSNYVRIFLNNQEIATGMFGSGFMMFGDMNLDFIDHIEVYFQNPTYEYTTESSLIVIKLYTKTAEKDNGGKIKTSYNLYNSKGVSLYTANQFINGWNYFNYLSYYQNRRKKYKVDKTSVYRNHPTFQILSSYYNKNNHFLLQAFSQNRDSFLDTSIDNTPISAKVKSKFLHLGYDGNIENFALLSDFDYKLTDSYFKDEKNSDDDYPIYMQIAKIDAKLFNTEIKYRFLTDKSLLIGGIKYRFKWFKYDKLIRNNEKLPRTGNTNQQLVSLFLENQFFFSKNSIFNFGIMGGDVKNNSSKQQDKILNYRIGHTYFRNKFIFKTILGHTEFSIDPILVNSQNYLIKDEKVKLIKNNAFQENIIYKNNNHKINFLYSYSIFKNYLVPDISDKYLLFNTDKKIKNYDIYLSYENNYNDIDKLFISGEYLFYEVPLFKKVRKYKYSIRNLQTFDKVDIFNEIVLTFVNDDRKFYYVYNCGVKYHYSNDLVFSLKGENIFNNSYKQYYMREDKDGNLLPVTKISPIDNDIILSMEYYF